MPSFWETPTSVWVWWNSTLGNKTDKLEKKNKKKEILQNFKIFFLPFYSSFSVIFSFDCRCWFSFFGSNNDSTKKLNGTPEKITTFTFGRAASSAMTAQQREAWPKPWSEMIKINVEFILKFFKIWKFFTLLIAPIPFVVHLTLFNDSFVVCCFIF